ncbi:MAG: VOC family protein, partial [Dehalococcoidales bacterium]|nr:VOC family protein [Dehalococcoidales bacterium]
IHLTSADSEYAARFYENNFGAKRVAVTKSADGNTSVELNLNGLRMLIRGASKLSEAVRDSIGKTYGLEHFGIMTNNIEAAVAELKSAGVLFRSEIREFRPGLRIAFFWAPDNVLVELMEIKAS